MKGIKIFCWPSYTCAPTRTGLTVTSYIPIDNYVCRDLKSFPSWQKDPNVKYGKSYFYGTYFSSIMFYSLQFGGPYTTATAMNLRNSSFSYNSYACSNRTTLEYQKSLNTMTEFIGTDGDKELFGGHSTLRMHYEDNNMASIGLEKFGLMTLYGEDYSTGNYKNCNYRYSFVFNLYPEVDLDNNYIDVYSNFKYNTVNVNEHYPYKNVIYRIDISNNKVRYYYGKYRPSNYKNPYNNVLSGFINEISGVSNPSYFGIYRNKLLPSKPVKDINKDYHHFAIAGFNNNYQYGVSYTYYGQLNGSFERNKLSYSLPNWTKTVNIDSSGWTYIYPPNYSGILTDMYSTSNDTKVTFVFSYFSMLAEYAE